MGDAVGDGHVAGDPDQTIDGTVPRADPLPTVVADAPREDYGELVAVERANYVVARELAKGGMGRVLEARDRRLGRLVAIKELLPKHRHAAQRFEREARITARLQHPAIIHVYEAGTWPGGEPFYAMPKVEGRSLSAVVAERATLVERLGLVPHVIAVADALAYAHSQRVIHRDLKPSNVLVGEFGETVVIDWGVAKDLAATDAAADSPPIATRAADETMTGSVVGTPAFMPPEQARGEPVDERADVYALGALLYTTLVGAPPYAGKTIDDVLEQLRAGPPIAVAEREPGTPPDLAAIVGKAMAYDRGRRYASAGELAADLKRFQTGQLVAAHRYTRVQLVRRWLHRRRLAVAIGMIAITAIAIVATLSLRRIVVEKTRAEARRFALLEERGRSELLDGHPGKALAYLAAAARDGVRGGVRGFLIADAMRPFQAQLATLAGGPLVAVSPDGKHVATAGDGELEVWSVDGKPDGKPELALGDHGRVRALAWDPSGARLAAAAGDTVWLWTKAGAPAGQLVHGSAAIGDIAFDKTGGKLVTAADDGSAIVWDTARGERLASSKCSAARLVSARFSDDGERIVTASEDGTACVWSASTGAMVTRLRGHTGPLAAALWAHADQWIVTASDDGSARVWSAALGKLVVAPLRHDAGSTVRVVALSHDSRLVLTAGSDGVARVWELPASAPDDGAVAPARRIATLAGHAGAIAAAAFSDDDAVVATGGVDRAAKLWDPARGQALASFEHGDDVASVAFAAGRERLVTGVRGGRAAIWNARVDEHVHELDSPVHALAVARDGTVAAGTDDSNVTLVHGDDTAVLRGHLSRVLAVAFTPDGTRLVSAGWDAKPIVWDVQRRTRIAELGEHVPPIRALAISPDGALVATAAGDGVQLWRLADGSLFRTFRDRGTTITALAFQPSGGEIYAGAEDGTLIAWQLASGSSTPRRALPTAVTAIAFSSRGALLIAGASRVDVYAHVDDRAPVQLDNPGEVRAALFTADGERVVTAVDEGAKVWDASTGRLLATRDPHASALEVLAIDGDTLWLGSHDGRLAAWDMHSDTSSADDIARFALEHDPWWLDERDAIRLR